jgi:hypothetical protein
MSIDVALFVHRAVVLPIRTSESVQLYSLRINAGKIETADEGIKHPNNGVINLALNSGVYGWSSASPVAVTMLDGVTAVTRSAKQPGQAVTAGGSKDPWPKPPPGPPDSFSGLSPAQWATVPDTFMIVAGT